MRAIGRAGPICQRAFVRPCKPMVIWVSLLDPLFGQLKGKNANTIVVCAGRKGGFPSPGDADLSKTAGAEGL
jgi:hypothetical protein